jgi:anti-sigma B factor antagonist
MSTRLLVTALRRSEPFTPEIASTPASVTGPDVEERLRPQQRPIRANRVFVPICLGERTRVDDAELSPPELLQVDARDAGTETVVTLVGELDISSTDWFGAFFGALLEKHQRSIAIDARRLTYMDSSGLRSFLRARASAHDAGVGFRIDNPPPQLRRVVERTGLRSMLLDE